VGPSAKTRKTDAQIKQEIIRESIASYREAAPVHTTLTGLAGDAACAARTVGPAAVPRFASSKM